MTQTAELRGSCETCRADYTPGWHTEDDGIPEHPPRVVPCPNKAAAKLVRQARQMETERKDAAKEAAKRIVSDAAHSFAEFSANQLRDRIQAAQIVSPGAMGQAFTWAKNQNLIEWTGRMVPSNDPDTHGHRIFVWRSLIHRRAA